MGWTIFTFILAPVQQVETVLQERDLTPISIRHDDGIKCFPQWISYEHGYDADQNETSPHIYIGYPTPNSRSNPYIDSSIASNAHVARRTSLTGAFLHIE